MTQLKRIWIVMLAIVALVLPATAQTDGTIVDVAIGNSDFSTLVAAMEAADPVVIEALEGTGAFTVFAPTNEAFENLLATLGITGQDLLAERELLTEVLLYHVVSGAVVAEDVLELDGESVPTLLSDNAISITIVDGGVVLNDVVNVIQTDIEASNGVIHVIDDVLLPTSALEAFGLAEETNDADTDDSEDATEEPEMSDDDASLGQGGGAGNTIVDIILDDQALYPRRFTILQQAIEAADPIVLETLQSLEGDYTLLAPPDFAFQNLVGSIGISLDDLLADTDLLTDVLLYHVYEGVADEATLLSLAGTIQPTLLEGEYFLVGINAYSDDLTINTVVEVIDTDIQADNGVIHIINDIILPYSILDALGLPRP